MIESVKEIQSLFKEIDDFLSNFLKLKNLKFMLSGVQCFWNRVLNLATNDIRPHCAEVPDFTLLKHSQNLFKDY